MSSNTNLKKAKKEKNDEFYTKLEDIENELKHYKAHFKNKIVFCNCDDPEKSNYWKYFKSNFEHLGLKKLISTYYSRGEQSYKLEINKLDTIKTLLQGDGDFRSKECIEILKESDIVVTNPPFSLFREFIQQLADYNKSFLVIGNQNAIKYKEIFKLIKENKLWLGVSFPKEFVEPDGSKKKFGNISWLTNLTHNKRTEKLILYKEYNAKEYPLYDNYNAINVDKIKDIPCDYKGCMGVPITIMKSHIPEQFEIIKRLNNPFVKGKEIYVRIVIRNLFN